MIVARTEYIRVKVYSFSPLKDIDLFMHHVFLFYRGPPLIYTIIQKSFVRRKLTIYIIFKLMIHSFSAQNTRLLFLYLLSISIIWKKNRKAVKCDYKTISLLTMWDNMIVIENDLLIFCAYHYNRFLSTSLIKKTGKFWRENKLNYNNATSSQYVNNFFIDFGYVP